MSLLLIAVGVLAVLTLGYLTYGTFVARQYRLDDGATTPAVARNDGVDFVPARPFYLMGQHFSAIAAAGPIVGPIAACLMFGWGPCLVWIVLGVVLIGAVHDLSALVASVRHGAHSIAEIAREHLGRRAWLALIGFIWVSLIYVIVAFTDVTAGAFVGRAEELELVQGVVRFNVGGAVAASSVMYLGLALVMGVVVRWLRPRGWVVTLVFVPATLGVVWLGTAVDETLVFGARAWHGAILVYCFVASLLPLWLLQQPRGYLGGFVLYLALGVSVVGLLFGGFSVHPEQAFYKGSGSLVEFLGGGADAPPMLGLLFPFLFVTIACGACSGFHGLVCGGTTSRQVAKESHCKPIGFGAMLLEGFVAVVALSTVMMVAPASTQGKSPSSIFGEGLANFLTVILGPGALLFAKTFGTMAVATFIFDTLDVATRLGRYLLQELVGRSGRVTGVVASALTAGVPGLVLLTGEPGSYRHFWTLFGTANQLLAALTLLCVTVWLRRSGRRYWYTLVPMVFVFVTTLTALGLQIVAGVRVWAGAARPGDGGSVWGTPAVMNAAVAGALLVFAALFAVEAVRTVARGRRAEG